MVGVREIARETHLHLACAAASAVAADRIFIDASVDTEKLWISKVHVTNVICSLEMKHARMDMAFPFCVYLMYFLHMKKV
jgi:hypothetical protein